MLCPVTLQELYFELTCCVLFLDLAESDLLYTQTILGEDRHCYKDKTVLVLGGGDGGILHELLKKEPKFVTMLEVSA